MPMKSPSSTHYLIFILLFILSSTSQLFCPVTSGLKKNVLQEINLNLPSYLSYDHSSLYRDGSQIYELTARVQGRRLYMEVIKKSYIVYRQWKDYETDIDIIAIKNQNVIIKVYAENRETWTYRLLRFDTTILASRKQTQATFDRELNLPQLYISNKVILLEVGIILGWKKDTMILTLTLISTNTTFLYNYEVLTDGFNQLGKVSASSLTNITGGNSNHVYDQTRNTFLVLNTTSSLYVTPLNTSLLFKNNFFPAGVEIGQIERDYVAYFSADYSTNRAVLLVVPSIVTNAWLEEFPASMDPPYFQDDKLSNFIAYNNQKFVWFNIQFSPFRLQKYVKSYSNATTTTSPENELITNFATSLGLYTISNWVFVLSAQTLKYFTISTVSTVNGVEVIAQKKQEIAMTDNLKASLQTATMNKMVVLSLRCLCASNSKLKLVCFNTNLQCIALTAKKFQECTVVS